MTKELKTGNITPELATSNLSRPYTVDNVTRMLVGNEKYGDVCFRVGENEPLWTSKALLALNSVAFDSMFYGNFQTDTSEPIDIIDLSYVGFLNMIKYICGFKMCEIIQLSEIYETYMVADKYLVTHMIDDLFDFIRDIITELNCCMIFDQMIRIKARKDEENSLLAKLRKMIQLNSDAVFMSNDFIDISKETLIDLLTMKTINTGEINVLKACIRWVNAEIERKKLIPNVDNKKAIFEPFKSLIRFTDLKTNELSDFDEIEEYLSTKELNSLLLHLIKKSRPLSISYKGPREAEKILEYCFSEDTEQYGRRENLISTFIYTIKSLKIVSLDTFLTNEIIFLELRILKNDGTQYRQKIENTLKNGRWSFEFQPPLELRSHCDYRFDFIFRDFFFDKRNKLSRQFELEFNIYKTIGIRLRSGYNTSHCIKRIEFFQDS